MMMRNTSRFVYLPVAYSSKASWISGARWGSGTIAHRPSPPAGRWYPRGGLKGHLPLSTAAIMPVLVLSARVSLSNCELAESRASVSLPVEVSSNASVAERNVTPSFCSSARSTSWSCCARANPEMLYTTTAPISPLCSRTKSKSWRAARQCLRTHLSEESGAGHNRHLHDPLVLRSCSTFVVLLGQTWQRQHRAIWKARTLHPRGAVGEGVL